MNRTTAIIILALALLLIGGFIGWNIKPSCAPLGTTTKLVTEIVSVPVHVKPVQGRQLRATRVARITPEAVTPPPPPGCPPCEEPQFVAELDTVLDNCDKVKLAYHHPQATFDISVEPCPDTARIPVTHTETTSVVEDSKRFGIGPAISYGYDPAVGQWRLTAGIAVTWHIFEW